MKKILTQFGMGLTQVLISMGLMGGIAVGTMTLMENMNKGQVTTETKMESIEIKRQVVAALMDRAACMATFSGKTIGASITEIKTDTGRVLFQTVMLTRRSSVVRFRQPEMRIKKTITAVTSIHHLSVVSSHWTETATDVTPMSATVIVRINYFV